MKIGKTMGVLHSFVCKYVNLLTCMEDFHSDSHIYPELRSSSLVKVLRFVLTLDQEYNFVWTFDLAVIHDRFDSAIEALTFNPLSPKYSCWAQ